jgi:hypothetical protein
MAWNITAGSAKTPDRSRPRPATIGAPRTSVARRRWGYVVAIAVNAAMLYAVNVWPSWHVVPMLTAGTRQVLAPIDASLVVGLVVSAGYLAYDPLWLRAAGDLLTAAVGLAALIRLWQVFPFDFTGYGAQWTVVLRVVLVVAIAGAAVGILINVVTAAWQLVLRGRQG